MKKILKIMLISMVLLTVSGCKKKEMPEDNWQSKPHYECSKLVETKNESFIKEDGTVDEEYAESIREISKDYKLFNMNDVYYEDGVVKELHSYSKFKYLSENTYENLKSDEEYMSDKIADDNNKTIRVKEGQRIDMRHDTDGNEQKLEVDKYLNSLKRAGFKCEEIK